MNRRDFLVGMGSLGAGAVGSAYAVTASTGRSEPFRIDVHHHLTPPGYISAITARGIPTLGMRPTVDWSPAKSLDDMDKAGVATSITSVTTPGVWFGDVTAARALARASNDYAARLMTDHPGRFGMFAVVPLPDIDGALRETEYALDVLKADGIALFTSYGNKWLGDASFAPLMDELNRRKAVVYTHPATADCCRNLVPGVPETIIEFGTDTSRTIASLVFSGTAARCPDIKFIFSHAGGTLPFLTERLVRLPILNPALVSRVPRGVLYELKRFYYDTAQASHPMALSSLMKLVETSQVLFGTDYPFRTSADHVQGLADFEFSDTERRAIERDNALRLLPRFGGVRQFSSD